MQENNLTIEEEGLTNKKIINQEDLKYNLSFHLKLLVSFLKHIIRILKNPFKL